MARKNLRRTSGKWPHRRSVTPRDGEWVRPTLTLSNTWFLELTQTSPQTASRSVQLFLQGSPTWQHTHTQTQTHRDRPRYSVCSNRLLSPVTMRPKIETKSGNAEIPGTHTSLKDTTRHDKEYSNAPNKRQKNEENNLLKNDLLRWRGFTDQYRCVRRR